MPASRRRFVLAATLALLSGCAVGRETSDPDRILRAAEDVPDHFLVGLPGSRATQEPSPGEGCRNPMVDPRDGRRVVLIRSAEGRGDYEAELGSYGLGARELLRLDCATGRVLGVVRR